MTIETGIEERIGDNLRVYVAYDDGGEYANPRDWCNLTTIRGWHRRMTIGDGPDIDGDRYEDFGDMILSLVDEHDAVMIAPLLWYEHSGVTCRMGTPYKIDGGAISMTSTDLARFRAECMDDAGWDSGVAGVVMVTAKQLAEIGTPTELIEQCARDEVETYAAWLRGEVYGYVVEETYTCERGKEHHDILDSCWGFVGETDYPLQEGMSFVGWQVASVLGSGTF